MRPERVARAGRRWGWGPSATKKEHSMAFIDKLSEDLVAAMRAKDTLRLGALRMAKAALMNREIERGRALDDSRIAAGDRIADQAAA